MSEIISNLCNPGAKSSLLSALPLCSSFSTPAFRAHAILSPSDELHALSKKADKQITYPQQKQYQIYVSLEPKVPYFQHFPCAQLSERQFVGHILVIAIMSL